MEINTFTSARKHKWISATKIPMTTDNYEDIALESFTNGDDVIITAPDGDDTVTVYVDLTLLQERNAEMWPEDECPPWMLEDIYRDWLVELSQSTESD